MNIKGDNILSGIVKRTYFFDEKGKCVKSPIQSPIIEEPVFYEDNPKLLQHDIDLFPVKLFTDVIIKGAIQLNRHQRQTIAKIKVGNKLTTILGIGKRKAYINHLGHLKFTEPEKEVDEIPLRYDYAYGGADVAAFEKNIPSPEEILGDDFTEDIDWSTANPYRYPRNPFGKGYMVEYNPKTFTEVELPMLEDPKDRLKPQRFFCHDPSKWYHMPIPRVTDWMNYEIFPRINYFGFQHVFYGDTNSAEEVKRDWVLPEVFDKQKRELSSQFIFRCTSGASLGLQIPYLRGNEVIQLECIHPKYSSFNMQLPSEVPQIRVDGRNGKMIDTSPVIHTIEIDLRKCLLSIVWRGSGNAKRPYHDEELKEMPFEVKW